MNTPVAVTLIREKLSLDNIRGFILGESDEWYFINVINEFHLDGYALIRKSTVDNISALKSEKKFNEIYNYLGIKPDPKVFPLNLESNIELFTSIFERGRIISVEDETEDDRYIIGRIEKIQKTHISMSHFTAEGKWWKKNTRIQYERISRVCLDSEYTVVWERFLNSNHG